MILTLTVATSLYCSVIITGMPTSEMVKEWYLPVFSSLKIGLCQIERWRIYHIFWEWDYIKIWRIYTICTTVGSEKTPAGVSLTLERWALACLLLFYCILYTGPAMSTSQWLFYLYIGYLLDLICLANPLEIQNLCLLKMANDFSLFTYKVPYGHTMSPTSKGPDIYKFKIINNIVRRYLFYACSVLNLSHFLFLISVVDSCHMHYCIIVSLTNFK